MTIEILAPKPIYADVAEALEARFTLHKLWEQDDPDAWLAANGARIRGVATFTGCDAALIAACPGLEIISSFGVGYDSVDIDAARARGIRVCNTPDVLSDAVAEMTMALMLALCREIPQAERHIRDGKWTAGNYHLTRELTGTTVGVLGLGRIGKEFAARAQAFRMHVVYHGRSRQAHVPYPYYADLTEMAAACDWLVCIAPGGAATQGLISRQVLEALGPEGCLVSIGRGTTIDEPAMIELLQSGGLGGAALDVFVDEPQVPEALLGLDNVVLSPHQGSATHKTRWAMGDLVVRNLAAHFANEPLISPVI